jgi:hypothetical protein
LLLNNDTGEIAYEPLMSNGSRHHEIRVDTIQVLEKEQASREKLLRSILEKERMKHDVLYELPIHPYIIIERLCSAAR